MPSGGGDSWLVHVLPWAAWSYLNETKTCAASGLSCSVADPAYISMFECE